MSFSRRASRSLANFERESSRCLRKSFATVAPRKHTRIAPSSCQFPLRNNSSIASRFSESLRYGRAVSARRKFSTTATTFHNHVDKPKPGEELHVTFIDKEGEEHTFEVPKGSNLLDIAQDNDIEMEGACGGSCACSTCHVIVEDGEMFDKVPEASDDENDMLDMAFGLQGTSRLGCQIVMTPEIDGIRVKLPSMTRNLQASDFSQKE